MWGRKHLLDKIADVILWKALLIAITQLCEG